MLYKKTNTFNIACFEFMGFFQIRLLPVCKRNYQHKHCYKPEQLIEIIYKL